MTAQPVRSNVVALRDAIRQGKPWSPIEIDTLIPQAMERKNEVVTSLLALGENAANAKWAHIRAEAKARVAAVAHFQGQRSAKEDREAWALLNWVDPDNQWSLDDYGLARDLAANAYRDQRAILDAAETDLKILQTLHVSARSAP